MMPKIFQLAIGLVIRRGERTFKFDRQLAADIPTYIFVDEITGEPKKYTLGELTREMDKGEVQVVSGEEVDSLSPREERFGLIQSFDSLPQKEQKSVERRYRYVMGAMHAGITRASRHKVATFLRGLGGFVPRQSETAEERERDPKPPGVSTLIRWLSDYQDSGRSLTSLVSGYVRRKMPKRLDEFVLKKCRECIDRYYLNKARRSIRWTTEKVQEVLDDLVEKGKLAREKAKVSETTVRGLLKEIDPYIIDLKRKGAAFANNKWRYSLAGARSRYPLMRYEIDHTVLDVVVVCEISGMPLGRPTITLVVDAFSGYIAGMFISFWGTGVASVLSALKVAILPKDDLTQALGLTQRWLPYGIPALFCVDNGLEFHSKDFMRAAMLLGSDVEYCGTRMPWGKPFVERDNGELMQYLPAQGRVFKPEKNYIPPSPEGTACITFSRLCKCLVSAVVKVHANRIDRGQQQTRLQLHMDGMAKMLPPRLPSSTKELELLTAVNKQCTVTHDGVLFSWLHYRSMELAQLRRATASNFRTWVKFNPEDLGHVYVQDPVSLSWLIVPCTVPEYASGLSLPQHKRIRSNKAYVLKASNAEEVLMQGKRELNKEFWDAIKYGKKIPKRAVQAVYGLTSSKSFQAAEQGVLDAPQPDLVVGGQNLPMDEAELIPEFDTELG